MGSYQSEKFLTTKAVTNRVKRQPTEYVFSTTPQAAD